MVLWFIGCMIMFGTRIMINMLSRNRDIFYDNKAVRIIINVLIMVCFVLVGGILGGEWIGSFSDYYYSATTIELVVIIAIIGFLTAIGALIMYAVIYIILGLDRFEEFLDIPFGIVLIVSIIGWSIFICQYNHNIDKTTQIVIESKEERELWEFCNIPVQKVSGEISGFSILGFGSVSGEITTADNLPYWYFNENGEAIFDSASAAESKLRFIIENNQSSYVEIVVYSTQTISKNNNDGTEYITTDKTWTEYIFYLPKALRPYESN